MANMVFDTETSGINPAVHCVLTAFFTVLDENDNPVDELDLKIKPDSGEIAFQEEALRVNGINLEEHKKEAITYSEARPLILEFFKKNSVKKRSLIPCGHNINFDINMIIGCGLLSQEEWDKFVHYRTLDTTPLTSFLKEVDILPSKVGNLGSLVEHFGLEKRNAHNAREDVLMWIDVFKAYKKMLIDIKKGALTSSESLDILLIE